MKKVLSIVVTLALLLSLSSNLWMTVYAVDGDITATVQGSYTKSDAEQDVTIRLELPNVKEAYCAFYIDTGIELPDGFAIKSFSTSNTAVQIVAADYNVNSGALNYDPVSSNNSIPAGTYYDVVITVPAKASGNFTIKFKDVNATDSTYNNVVAEDAEITATLTITDGSSGGGTPADGYTATIANGTVADTICVGDIIKINVGSNKDFAATEMTITYSSNLVEFNKAASTLGNAKVTDNGGLQLADYGENKTAEEKYVLAFTAISDGVASFTVADAAFGTGTSAETANLTNAGASGELKITIAKKQHAVTLPNIFAGAATVNDGESYTFTPETATGAYYNYTDVTATMGGNPATVTGDATAGWTIANVTGDLVISGTRTPKQYNVTVNGEGNAAEEKVTLPAGQPTYLTDYTFTIPANKAANTEAGYTYELTSMTIGGTAHTGYQVNGREYTILGTAITGDVVITVTKTVVDPNQFTVGKTGNGAGDAVIAEGTVAKDANAVLTLTEDKLYKYTVSATMGGETAEVTKSGNTYTVSGVNGAVVFTVTKTLNIDSAAVKQYVQLNGTSLWLVTINGNGTEQISGKTYSFNGSNMYWSSQYKCYVTLVAAAEQPTVTDGFELVTVAEVPAITYGMDVNGTGDTDANDAQLVYNMYSAVYVNFTDNVPMEKFLRADVNGDKTVNTSDAAAIINSILGLSNN